MSCKKAQGFLESNDWTVGDVSDAAKERHGRAGALALARQVERILVAKGKKIVSFDMRREPPDDDTLLAHMLGPTGNLRAPTLKKGKTLLVGFSEESYRQFLGD